MVPELLLARCGLFLARINRDKWPEGAYTDMASPWGLRAAFLCRMGLL